MLSAIQPQVTHSLDDDFPSDRRDSALNPDGGRVESRPMMNAMDALRALARPVPMEQHVPAAAVVAIVRLRESRRSWFVTAVHQQQHAIEIVGYTPGCMHASGRSFSLRPDFFERAATASGDQLDIEFLKTPVPLEMLEDDSL
jgi:hypothetical protein